MRFSYQIHTWIAKNGSKYEFLKLSTFSIGHKFSRFSNFEKTIPKIKSLEIFTNFFWLILYNVQQIKKISFHLKVKIQAHFRKNHNSLQIVISSGANLFPILAKD